MPSLDRNLPVNSSSASEIKNKLKELFEKLNCAARISLALEFFLRNVYTDDYRCYDARDNKTLFEKSPFLCSEGNSVSLQERAEKRIWLRVLLKK